MNWTVPSNMWKDQEVWIIGGGPSVSRQFHVPESIIDQLEVGKVPVSIMSSYMKPIHDKPVIGVNMSFLLGSWIDLVIFGDPSFFDKKGVKKGLLNFPGIKIGAHQFYNCYNREAENIMAIAREKERSGLSNNPSKIRWNYNSGGSAINIAVLAGAKRIILVGFDMHSIPTHSHWHNMYGKPKFPNYEQQMKGFQQIAIDAKARGIEIINASPDSAIDCFPKANVCDLIKLTSPVFVDTNVERAIGKLHKYHTLSYLHKLLKPDVYLEIGVGRGNSLFKSTAKLSIGVDPNPKIIRNLPSNTKVYKEDPDDFFERESNLNIDLAFIDGKHLIEQVLLDFMNIEKNCKKDATILIDDIFPAHPIQASRVKQTCKWTGDVWKIIPILHKYRPDLDINLLDVNPTGMAIISNLSPLSDVLEKNYANILDEWKRKEMPLEITRRDNVYGNLSFLQYEKRDKIKVGVITPTCSVERLPFLNFLKKRMGEQTRQPDTWYLIDYPNNTDKPDLTKRYKEGIKKAIDDKCDFILFMEDDDFYPKTYIEDMVEGWILAGKPSLFGVDDTIYYHIGNKKFRFFQRKAHCSAFCTAVTKDVNFDVCKDDCIFFDMRLWKANPDHAKIRLDPGKKPIGIKHGLGKVGGSFHQEYKLLQEGNITDYIDKEALDIYQTIIK